MIIGININTIGDRYIAYVKHDNNLTRHDMTVVAEQLKDFYDEVYITDFDGANDDFIQYVVLKGCRV